jgi:hypothetical protein
VPDLAEWTVLLLERQARLVDLVASRVPLVGRLSDLWLARLLDWAGVFLLLVLGVIIGSSVVWALLAIPMTICVLAFLAGLESTAAPAKPRHNRRRARRSRRIAAGMRPGGA